MPSLCNSTLSSSPDKDECHYWSSFSEKPFSCGDRLQVYKGKLNGKGPRGGDFSVVKVCVFVAVDGSRPQSSQLAEPLWTDLGLKRGIGVHLPLKILACEEKDITTIAVM